MTDSEILDLVVKMRDAQCVYYRNPTKVNLAQAKDYERRVDTALESRGQGRLA